MKFLAWEKHRNIVSLINLPSDFLSLSENVFVFAYNLFNGTYWYFTLTLSLRIMDQLQST